MNTETAIVATVEDMLHNFGYVPKKEEEKSLRLYQDIRNEKNALERKRLEQFQAAIKHVLRELPHTPVTLEKKGN